MRVGVLSCLFVAWCAGSALATGADCPGNPDALGVSRTIVVDPTEHPRLGTMQYRETLPLEDHEVVLTFDDGPLPPYSTRVLDILAAECVKATYFLVGRMARAYPDVVRKIHAAGHSIGTHSENHPLTFNRMPLGKAEEEIENGITSVAAVLGDPKALAPFFRVPGLLRAEPVEQYLARRSLQTWSADFPADDWTQIKADEITRRALARLEAKGKGILLLHDIQPATVLALPGLLRELKARGYRIVHVEAAGPGRPVTPTVPAQWRMHGDKMAVNWPRPSLDRRAQETVLPAPSPQSFGFPFAPKASFPGLHVHLPAASDQGPVWPAPNWPDTALVARIFADGILPAPSPASFGPIVVEQERPARPSVATRKRTASVRPQDGGPTAASGKRAPSGPTGARPTGQATAARMPKTGLP